MCIDEIDAGSDISRTNDSATMAENVDIDIVNEKSTRKRKYSVHQPLFKA
jgi:DNA-binding transcriptional regulator GbsR (MarR family)